MLNPFNPEDWRSECLARGRSRRGGAVGRGRRRDGSERSDAPQYGAAQHGAAGLRFSGPATGRRKRLTRRADGKLALLVNSGGSWHDKLTFLVTHFSLPISAYPFQGHRKIAWYDVTRSARRARKRLINNHNNSNDNTDCDTTNHIKHFHDMIIIIIIIMFMFNAMSAQADSAQPRRPGRRGGGGCQRSAARRPPGLTGVYACV